MGVGLLYVERKINTMKKTVTLKNFEIIEILRKLNTPDSIVNSTSVKYPVSFLWKVNGNLKKLSEIEQRIVAEEQKINDAYSTEEKATQDESGWQVKEEYRNEFINEKNELFEIENEICVDVVRVADIMDLEFSPVEFNSIAFMLTDEDSQ